MVTVRPSAAAGRESRVDALVQVYSRFARRLKPLRFAPPIAHTYHTTDYAWPAFEQYLRRFALRGAKTVLLGMNPGPWGMVQTGVPFGDVASVREWLHIDAQIRPPAAQHPRRPILGLECRRIEVSGRRVWGWAASRFGSPVAFFERFFVLNYCPLAWLARSGANVTPDKLPAAERLAVEAACDHALRESIDILNVDWVVGVGKYAEQRARAALQPSGTVRIASILHPSPASPAANRGWAEQAERQLASLGIAIAPPGSAAVASRPNIAARSTNSIDRARPRRLQES